MSDLRDPRRDGGSALPHFLQHGIDPMKHRLILRDAGRCGVLWGSEHLSRLAGAAAQLVYLGLGHIDAVVQAGELVPVLRHTKTDSVEDVVSDGIQVLQRVHDLPNGLLSAQVGQDHRHSVGLCTGRHVDKKGVVVRT